MKEEQHINGHSYLPIPRDVRKSLKRMDKEQLEKLGVSEVILFMIGRGYVRRLREDVLNDLSRALGLDTPADR